MRSTGDDLHELAEIVDHIEDEHDATVRDIGVEFVTRGGALSTFMAFFGVSNRKPVFQLTIETRGGATDDDSPDRDGEDDVEIDVDVDVEESEAVAGGESDNEE